MLDESTGNTTTVGDERDDADTMLIDNDETGEDTEESQRSCLTEIGEK